MTKVLAAGRSALIERMVEEAEGKGAVAMGFDTSELGSISTESCAYRTAVRAHVL